jgi:serine/threonine protein kinase
VIIDDDGTPKLIDFGLSKTLNAETSTELKWSGSIPWSAPELLDGEGKTKASDVYAYAIIVFEVLYRRRCTIPDMY